MTNIQTTIQQVIDKNNHKFPNQLREPIANFLRYSMTGYALYHKYSDELCEFMSFLASPIQSPSLASDFRTDSFFKDNFPEVFKSPIFEYFCTSMYNMKQKNYGAGEALLAMFFDDIEQAGKIGDFVLSGRHVEVKSVVSAASLKAHEDSSFRPSNKAFEELYGEKETGLNQFWDGPLDTFKKYCKILYPQFSEALVEEIHKLGSDSLCRQHLGLQVLKEYKKIDEFDNLVVLRPTKDGDISFLNVVDFANEDFIKQNIGFTPNLHRGKGTQALGDGYVDIKLK